MTWRAHVQDSRQYWNREANIELYLLDEWPTSGEATVAVAAVDGTLTLQIVREGVASPNPLLILTKSMALAMYAALQEYLKNQTPDPGTEAKVLREWLAVEQGRVDRALGGG